jgi:hypothetical protein
MQPAAEETALECNECGAALRMEGAARTAKCLYCASPSVVARPPSRDRPEASFALGFVVAEARALEIARRWIRRPLFAPEAFRRAVPSEIRGLYVPAYLFSAEATCDFQASIGENYTVTETYTTTDGQGKTVVRTRTRTETEWRSLSGRYAAYVQDRVVTASKGIANAELEAIEPFDMRALCRYTPKLISGWAAEEPSLAQAECRALAQGEARAEIESRLDAFMPGDSHRELRYSFTLAQENLALTLLPVWVLPVRYHPEKPIVRLLVNGQTGAIAARVPRSWPKIIGAVSLGLLVIALVVLFVTERLG